jgi:hypothetical protein
LCQALRQLESLFPAVKKSVEETQCPGQLTAPESLSLGHLLKPLLDELDASLEDLTRLVGLFELGIQQPEHQGQPCLATTFWKTILQRCDDRVVVARAVVEPGASQDEERVVLIRTAIEKGMSLVDRAFEVGQARRYRCVQSWPMRRQSQGLIPGALSFFEPAKRVVDMGQVPVVAGFQRVE